MSWKIDPATGDYLMENGSPVEDSSLVYPAFYRLRGQRGKWLHAPDANWGSDLYTTRQSRLGAREIPRIKGIMQQALQPMIDDGRASDVDVQLPGQQTLGRNETEAFVTITDAEGSAQELNLPPVGD